MTTKIRYIKGYGIYKEKISEKKIDKKKIRFFIVNNKHCQELNKKNS